MTEDAPLEPVAPEPVTAPTEAASKETKPAATASGPPPWGAPPAADATKPPSSSTIAVPKWLVLVVAALVFAGLGFAVGYAVAPNDDNGTSARQGPGFVVPSPSENGNGSGSQPTTPSTPRQFGGAFLGVSTSRSTDPTGVRVVQVIPGSPAADAGVKAEDVITKVDDATVANPTRLGRIIRSHKDGDEVTVTYVRDGSTHTARVTLVTRNVFQIPTPSTTRPRS